MTAWSARPTEESAGSKQMPRIIEDAAARDTRTWAERIADDDGNEVVLGRVGVCVCVCKIDYY